MRAIDRYSFERRQLHERSQTSVDHASQLLDGDIGRASTLLTAVSPMLDPALPPARLDSLLRAVFANATDDISNVWVADTNGVVTGTLVPVPTGMRTAPTLAALEYFKAARASGTFTVGQPVRSRFVADSPWVIPMVQPIQHPGSRTLRGYVGMGLRMDRLAAMRFVQKLPENSVLTVLRTDGRVFVRNRDLDQWINRSFHDDPRFATDQQLIDSTETIRSLDGTERMVTMRRLTTLPAIMYLGIPATVTRAAVRSQFILDLLVGLTAVLVFAAIALLAARHIANPLIALADVASALARGDRNRRAVAQGNDEVADLARRVQRHGGCRTGSRARTRSQ